MSLLNRGKGDIKSFNKGDTIYVDELKRKRFVASVVHVGTELGYPHYGVDCDATIPPLPPGSLYKGFSHDYVRQCRMILTEKVIKEDGKF